jgi:hypothetical protein
MVVPFPTPPNVKPLISLSVSKAIPPNSIRTYLMIPELSLSSVPPKVEIFSPSIVAGVLFTVAFTKYYQTTPITIVSATFCLIGCKYNWFSFSTFSNIILLLVLLINVALVDLSPLMMVPGSMVKCCSCFYIHKSFQKIFVFCCPSSIGSDRSFDGKIFTWHYLRPHHLLLFRTIAKVNDAAKTKKVNNFKLNFIFKNFNGLLINRILFYFLFD